VAGGQVEIGGRRRVIDSGDQRTWPDLAELWRHRELLFFLAWRDVQLRYNQTALGVLWAILQPLMTTVLLSLVFARVPGFSPPGVPYPVYCYAGFLVWLFFSSGIVRASTSLSSQNHVLSKVYFPRLLVPLAAILGCLPDLVVGSLGLVALMAGFRILPGLNVLWLPAFVLLVLLLTLAIGIWLAALGTRYQDIRHAIPFFIQFWMLATPVFYSTRLVEARFNGVLFFNPISAALEGLRWSLGIGIAPAPVFVLGSLAAAVLLLAGGVVYFNRATRDFVDGG
jgi:lipopolysaccharide transport system permease protein